MYTVSRTMQRVLLAIYIPAILYGININLYSLNLPKETLNSLGKYTTLPLTILPLLGAFFGFYNAKKWGGTRSVVGKFLIFVSAGTAAWGGGMLVWIGYIFLAAKESVPYPSLSDFIFIWAQPLWMVGIYHLSRAIGAQRGMGSKNGKTILVLSSLVAMLISYILLLQVARGGNIQLDVSYPQLFFDFYYPLGTAVSLSMVMAIFSLSYKYLGGIYTKSVHLLFAGFIAQYLGDFWYTYANATDTYFNGHWSDMLFTTAMLLISLGLANIAIEE